MKNGELKIEKGVPIPQSRVKGYAAVLRKLKVGESVLLPVTAPTARLSAQQNLGVGKYACRNEGAGARVWRIK